MGTCRCDTHLSAKVSSRQVPEDASGRLPSALALQLDAAHDRRVLRHAQLSPLDVRQAQGRLSYASAAASVQ